MITYSPRQEDYRDLAHSLATFTSLTQIKTMFFGFNGILLADDFVYLNTEAIESTLIDETFENYAVFPVSLNEQLWGSIMCDATNVSKKRLFLSRSYLQTIMNGIIDSDSLGEIKVWEPLTTDQISQINYLHALFGKHKQPNSPLTTATTPAHAMKLDQLDDQDAASRSIALAVNYIHQNIQQSLSLNEVAQKAFLSPSYLSRLFKKYLHVNFVEYVNNQKVALAQEKLALSQDSVQQISNQIGFSQTSYFTKIFKRKTGLTPSEFRQRNHTIQKIYTIPRKLDWQSNESVYDISKNFFKANHINYFADSTEGTTYVNKIGDLGDTDGNRGWVYTVDGQQPLQSADETPANDKSVIQWVYTNYSQADAPSSKEAATPSHATSKSTKS